VKWYCEQLGQLWAFTELSQRINRLTTDSSGSCPRLGTAFGVATLSRRRRFAADSDSLPSEFTISIILSTNQA